MSGTVGGEHYDLQVDGVTHAVADAALGESLLFVLRERLGQPATKNACDQGECGSCSVLLDDRLVCACTVLAADAAGSSITTLTGLDRDGDVADVQQAFLAAGAVQCGFCTPGLVVAAHHLLAQQPQADDLAIREALSGNLCRCTGYGRILQAVAAVRDTRLRHTGTTADTTTAAAAPSGDAAPSPWTGGER